MTTVAKCCFGNFSKKIRRFFVLCAFQAHLRLISYWHKKKLSNNFRWNLKIWKIESREKWYLFKTELSNLYVPFWWNEQFARTFSSSVPQCVVSDKFEIGNFSRCRISLDFSPFFFFKNVAFGSKLLALAKETIGQHRSKLFETKQQKKLLWYTEQKRVIDQSVSSDMSTEKKRVNYT